MPVEYDQQEQALLSRIGLRIKELRKETGLSQEDFAPKAGLDRTYISDVERGRRNISVINLAKIAKALKVKPSALLD